MGVLAHAETDDRVHCFAMSGWGCRYQVDEQCVLLRKECKPGRPGCVLYRKVTFIGEVEKATAKRKATKKAGKRK